MGLIGDSYGNGCYGYDDFIKGSGEGDGLGSGFGYGYSDDFIEGSGEGDGLGSGLSYGYGDDFIEGSGEGDGLGSGLSYGYSDDFGDGFGYGYGDDFIEGSGEGYGEGSSCGEGSSYGAKKVTALTPIRAYHYISEDLTMRDGHKTKVGEHLHQDEIQICKKGYHASLTIADAKKYAPENSILTEVLVWGDIIFDHDKLVASDRKLIKVLESCCSIYISNGYTY